MKSCLAINLKKNKYNKSNNNELEFCELLKNDHILKAQHYGVRFR